MFFEVFTPAIIDIDGAHIAVRLSAVLLVPKPRTFDRGSKKNLFEELFSFFGHHARTHTFESYQNNVSL